MQNETILLTGGTGSFGKAFVAWALTQEVKQIRVLSRDEFKQHQMSQEFNDPRIEYLLGDVRDLERVKTAVRGCTLVIHAAAIKRIEKAERDPEEAIKTNIQGTINVAKAALEENVRTAVLISTDKACEPINLYGATKMVAEKYWIQANGYRGALHTKFTVVRYGNVVNSRGSVIPTFKKQADGSGVIKVTHPDMTRFFLTLEAAVALVYCAVNFGQGGEIFLPVLKAAKITDLAKAVDSEASIEFIGMGSYEKLHEQLYNQSEAKRLVEEDGYWIIEPEYPKWPFKFDKVKKNKPVLNSKNVEQFDMTELKRFTNE